VCDDQSVALAKYVEKFVIFDTVLEYFDNEKGSYVLTKIARDEISMRSKNAQRAAPGDARQRSRRRSDGTLEKRREKKIKHKKEKDRLSRSSEDADRVAAVGLCGLGV